MRLVRSRASEWGLDPNRIGMVGFSAGGEVVSMTAFGETSGDANAPDPIDKVSARPDFIVEIFPGGAGIPQTLPSDAPPAFLLVANDDDHTDRCCEFSASIAPPEFRSRCMFSPEAQHAFNMGNRSKLTTIKNWPQRLADWMGDNNLSTPPYRPKMSNDLTYSRLSKSRMRWIARRPAALLRSNLCHPFNS